VSRCRYQSGTVWFQNNATHISQESYINNPVDHEERVDSTLQISDFKWRYAAREEQQHGEDIVKRPCEVGVRIKHPLVITDDLSDILDQLNYGSAPKKDKQIHQI
jgi:hypothetical protein